MFNMPFSGNIILFSSLPPQALFTFYYRKVKTYKCRTARPVPDEKLSFRFLFLLNKKTTGCAGGDTPVKIFKLRESREASFHTRASESIEMSVKRANSPFTGGRTQDADKSAAYGACRQKAIISSTQDTSLTDGYNAVRWQPRKSTTFLHGCLKKPNGGPCLPRRPSTAISFIKASSISSTGSLDTPQRPGQKNNSAPKAMVTHAARLRLKILSGTAAVIAKQKAYPPYNG